MGYQAPGSIACKTPKKLVCFIMENEAKWQPVTSKAGKDVAWNTHRPDKINPYMVIVPPQNHNGYVVIQDDKIIGPRYKYYETAWENEGSGIVTSFDFAVRNMWV